MLMTQDATGLADPWLPHPDSPVGRNHDWAAQGLAHPDSPVGLSQPLTLLPLSPSTAAAPQLRALRPRTPPAPVRPSPPARRAASRPRGEAAPAAAAEHSTHWVEFRYVMQGTQLPASDRVACVLTHPSGQREELPLSKGKLRRDAVEPGTYALKARHLAGVSWSPACVHAGEEARLSVSGANVPDGEVVEIQVHAQHAPEGSPPLQTLQAKFSGGMARAAWAWQQARGEAPHGTFIARARWRSKCAESGPLKVEAYPASDERGLQQRLKHLGLYGGAIDGAPATTAPALQQLEQTWPFLQDHGVTDAQRREFVAAATY
jgi:hypothetical protein